MWIATTKGLDKKVYLSHFLFLTHLSARGRAHCSTSYGSFYPAHLQLPNYLTYTAPHVKEMQNKILDGFMPLIQVLWYCDKFVTVETMMQWPL